MLIFIKEILECFVMMCRMCVIGMEVFMFSWIVWFLMIVVGFMMSWFVVKDVLIFGVV